MTHYSGDPYWLERAKFGNCATCGKSVKGQRAFYYPKHREVYCQKHGEIEAASFHAAAQDEDFYMSQYGAGY